jgi:ABC-type uncharacterized transport system substrate-binding protein
MRGLRLNGSAAAMLAFLAGLFWQATPPKAHPHVWVTVWTDVEIGADAVTGFRHRWTFDEFYTAFAIQGLDKNGDGQYSREELQELADVNIQSLKEFGFFTFAELGSGKIAISDPEDYWLDYKDGVLTLHFMLPLAVPVQANQLKGFKFSVYDPTFYVAFSFADETPVKLAAQKAVPCNPRLHSIKSGRSEVPLGVDLGDAIGLNSGAAYAQDVTFDCKA